MTITTVLIQCKIALNVTLGMLGGLCMYCISDVSFEIDLGTLGSFI